MTHRESFPTEQTLLVAPRTPSNAELRPIVAPIHQSASFEGERFTEARYLRFGNTPDQESLSHQLAQLEGAEAGWVFASGMAAISTAYLGLLASGDHVIAQRSLYGATHTLLTSLLPRFGIDVDLVDGRDISAWRRLVRPSTKLLYVEVMSNPTLEVPDFDAVVALGRESGALTAIDNTLATPLGFPPFEVGFDLSLQSATKYLNGHEDLLAGVVTGRRELIDRIAATARTLGATLDPHASFLLQRGLRTLVVRLSAQSASALALARFLAQRAEVDRVYYPGLESHPDHPRARRHLRSFGAVLSFELRGPSERAAAFMTALRLIRRAPSLGGVQSLAMRPALLSHAELSASAREAMGLSENLVRLSIGLEHESDLRDDIAQALDAARTAGDRRAVAVSALAEELSSSRRASPLERGSA